ncbi:hypothetical protein D3C71_1787260 [compost metagenome]
MRGVCAAFSSHRRPCNAAAYQPAPSHTTVLGGQAHDAANLDFFAVFVDLAVHHHSVHGAQVPVFALQGVAAHGLHKLVPVGTPLAFAVAGGVGALGGAVALDAE